MGLYEVSARTTLVTATIGAPLCALRAVTAPLRVREIHIFYVTAPTTSGSLALVRSTALGTGTLTSVTPQARSALVGTPAATALLVTAWATLAPTNGGAAAMFRRFVGAATIGNGVIWTFDQESLGVAGSAGAASELIIANGIATAPGTFDVTFVYEE